MRQIVAAAGVGVVACLFRRGGAGGADAGRGQGTRSARLRRLDRHGRLRDGRQHGRLQGARRRFSANALSAAIFGVPNKVKFVPLSAPQRFTALQSGEIDVLSRNSTWTLQREGALGLLFGPVTFYDGQGFMVAKKLGVKSAKDLSGATICVQPGTTTELNLADYFRSNKLQLKPVVIENLDEIENAFFSGRCDAYTTDASGLAGTRLSKAPNPDDYVILPERISKEPADAGRAAGRRSMVRYHPLDRLRADRGGGARHYLEECRRPAQERRTQCAAAAGRDGRQRQGARARREMGLQHREGRWEITARSSIAMSARTVRSSSIAALTSYGPRAA